MRVSVSECVSVRASGWKCMRVRVCESEPSVSMCMKVCQSVQAFESVKLCETLGISQ